MKKVIAINYIKQLRDEAEKLYEELIYAPQQDFALVCETRGIIEILNKILEK